MNGLVFTLLVLIFLQGGAIVFLALRPTVSLKVSLKAKGMNSSLFAPPEPSPGDYERPERPALPMRPER